MQLRKLRVMGRRYGAQFRRAAGPIVAWYSPRDAPPPPTHVSEHLGEVIATEHLVDLLPDTRPVH